MEKSFNNIERNSGVTRIINVNSDREKELLDFFAENLKQTKVNREIFYKNNFYLNI